MKNALIMMFIFIIMINTALATTPTISNVSGIIANGQTLTITGTNMMDEDKTNWDTFFTTHPTAYGFEGTSPAVDFYCEGAPCKGEYDSTFKLTGNQTIKWNIIADGPCDAANSCGDYDFVYTTGTLDDIWIRLYGSWELVSGSWPDAWLKMMMDYTDEGTDYYYDVGYTDTGDYPTTMLYKIGDNSYTFNIPSGKMTSKRWYCMEVHWSNGEYAYYMDGELLASGVPSVNDNISGLYIGMINLGLGAGKSININNWFDGLAFGSSRIYPSSTIEIANSSNYITATKRYQEPVYLSDGSVQIKADLTDLGSGPYYLFVTNNRQEVSTAYSLTSTLPAPVIGNVTTGKFYVNTSWSAGSGNVTDSYNTTNDTTWINSTLTYRNTTLSAHAWQNLTVYAYNITYNELSNPLTNNTQIPNNAITISDISLTYSINETDTLNIDANYTDDDSDTGVFGDNSSQWDVNTSTGIVSWTAGGSDSGVYNWLINVTDGYGSTSTYSFVVTVNDTVQNIPTPVIFTVITGSYWKNITWSAGSGVVTDSYNVSRNGTWYNGTATFLNTTTTIDAWINDTIYAYNNTIGLSTPLINNIPIPNSTVTGIDFPGSEAVATTMRFNFSAPHLNGLPIYGTGGQGVTYIWKIYPRQQNGYYTTFFWGNDDGVGDLTTFLWHTGYTWEGDTYYGAHPYPSTYQGPDHNWEIAVMEGDYVNGAVVKDQWYTQALRVWSNETGKHHEFYWDLPNTDANHMVSISAPTTYGETNPPYPTLTWGDAPWAPGNEVLNGTLRGLQIYSKLLSTDDIINETTSPRSTTEGAANIWYLNINPKPTDISDKSGEGHNPVWVGDELPTLYLETDYLNVPPTPIINSTITGNFYVNTSWSAGAGNVTDGYNSTNGTIWINSTSTFRNTTLLAHSWQNLTIYAWNSTDNVLSDTPLTNNTQIPNNIPVQSSIGNKNIDAVSWLNFTISSTDVDGDTLTYGTNASKGTLNTTTGDFNWSITGSDNGVYHWTFNTTDNYSAVDTETITVTVGIDVTSPIYLSVSHNQTVASLSTLFSVQYNDEGGLPPNGQWIFATNNTGEWVNESAVNWTATPEWANVSMVLNTTIGAVIGYRWYASDNLSNWNNTPIYTLTVTPMIYSDDFNRANGSLGSNWTNISEGGAIISDNKVFGVGSFSGNIRTGENYSHSSNQFSEIEITSDLTGINWVASAVKIQDDGITGYVGLYFWGSGTPELKLYRREDGGWNQLSTTYYTDALPAGTKLRTATYGSIVYLLVDGVIRISYTDTNLTGGNPGIYFDEYSSGIDNWTGGDYVPEPMFTIGGNATNLTGVITLQNNGEDNLNVLEDGIFAFSTAMLNNSNYSVTVSSSFGQSCNVTNGSGIALDNVTNIDVTCTPTNYIHYHDDFNRANENPMTGNWTADYWGGTQIISNAVYSVDGDSGVSTWNYFTPELDQFSEAAVIGLTYYPGVAVRTQPGIGTSYFLFVLDSNTLQIWRFNLAAWELLRQTTTTSTMISGVSRVRLEVTGTDPVTLKMYLDGVQQGTDLLDSSELRITTAGRVGIHGTGQANGIDNWTGGNLYEVYTPLITNILNGTVNSTSATINFTLNQTTANTYIKYGENTSLLSQTSNQTYGSNRTTTITNLSPDTLYYYSVFAHNSVYDSLYSNSTIQNFTTTAGDLSAPESITGVSCVGNGTGFYINCSWVNPSDTDYNHLWLRYSNGISYIANITTPTHISNISWSAHADQNLSGQTVDTVGNINTTLVWLNATVPNNAPIQSVIGSKSVNEGSWLNFSISSTDVDGDALTYATNTTNGTLTTNNFNWSVTYSDSGTYYWTFNTTDNYSAVDTETITVTVTNINQIPPVPVIDTVTNGSSWVNQSWTAGSGNTTDSYNVSVNGTWTNGTTVLFINTTGISANGWANLTVYAWNSTDNVLSSTALTNNTQTTQTSSNTPPVIVLLSQTPSTISQNTTGLLNQTWGITHSATGLNNSTIALIHTVYDFLQNTHNYSIRPPSNDKSAIWSITGEQILRATNRNETLTFENNATITDGNIYEWGGEDYNSSYINIVPVNSTYTTIYFNNSISSAANANMWYLDRSDMETSVKTPFLISKGVSAMVKYWDMKTAVLPTHIVTVNIDTSLTGTASTSPIEVYYLNNSFNPLGAVQPEVSPYSHFITTLNATQWTNHVFSPSANASYITLTFNTSSILSDDITPTTVSYLYFKSEAKLENAYQINVTNVATSTNVTFANTGVMWTGKDAPFTAYSYTPNIYFSFTHSNQRFDSKLFVADNDGLWGNSTLQSTNIDVSLYPPDTPNIDHFHSPTPADFDYNMNSTYNGTFNVGVGLSHDPDGGIVTHNLSLWYANRTYIATINNTFTNLDVAHDNVYADISFNTTPYYSETESYTLKVVATDDEGMSAESWLRDNFTLDDTTPPASITGISSSATSTEIVWTWTNPTDTDFNYTSVYLDGAFKTNTSAANYTASSLTASTSYTISTKTVDTYGNINTSWANDTKTTSDVASSGGSGGGGGGSLVPYTSSTPTTTPISMSMSSIEVYEEFIPYESPYQVQKSLELEIYSIEFSPSCSFPVYLTKAGDNISVASNCVFDVTHINFIIPKNKEVLQSINGEWVKNEQQIVAETRDGNYYISQVIPQSLGTFKFGEKSIVPTIEMQSLKDFISYIDSVLYDIITSITKRIESIWT